MDLFMFFSSQGLWRKILLALVAQWIERPPPKG